MPKWIKSGIGLALIVFVLSLSFAVFFAVYEFRKLEPSVVKLIQDSDLAVNTTSGNINSPCRNDKESCGTLADVNQTLHTIRGTFGQIEIAAKHENSNLTVLDSQENQLFAKTNSMFDQFQGTLGSANTAILGIVPVENQVKDEFGLLKDTNTTLNSYLNSEPFRGTVSNFYEISGNLAGISDHLDSLSGDISNKTHEFLYPVPCYGKVCWVKRAYTILKDVGPLAEPMYFGIEAGKAIKGIK